MLTIRLQRAGKKHQPSFRLVVAERRSKLVGPPTEDLGSYDIFEKKAAFKRDRVLHWLKMGAQATASVHNLLVKEGVIAAPKRKIPIRPAKGSEVTPAAAAPAAEITTTEAPAT